MESTRASDGARLPHATGVLAMERDAPNGEPPVSPWRKVGWVATVSRFFWKARPASPMEGLMDIVTPWLLRQGLSLP